MSELGQIVLCLSMWLSASGGALALAGRRPAARRSGEKLLLSAAAAAAAAVLILAFLLLNHDYRNAYVYTHADRNMGVGYLLCAVWGGQAGSFLLWAALQTFFTAAVVLFKKEKPRFALGFLAALQTFLAATALFHSNPFEPAVQTSMRGLGMNPLLLNPFMAVHPPTLFLGFVGFSVPTAFSLQALLEKPFRPDWIDRERPWVLFAWLFLSIGNILGMVWAYEELGWGGYWGWDPVENASFMPWLTSTALVHLALIKKPVKKLGLWTAALPMLTFCLIFFGTFITRSGVIQSVHAFSDATAGPYLLGLIVFSAALLTGLLIYRRRDLVSGEEVPGILSRKNLIRLTLWVLMLSAAFVWLGTMAPLFTELFKGEKVASTPAFFNKWMVPLGLSLLFLLGLCLAIENKAGLKGPKLVRSLAVPGIAAALSAVLLSATRGYKGPAALISFALLGLTGAAAARKIHRLARTSSNTEARFSKRRALGAHIVHAGVVCLFLGFTGKVFTEEHTKVMRPGDTMHIEDYQVTFLGVRDDNDYQRYALLADLDVKKSGRPAGIFSAARFFYHSHPEQPTSEPAILRTLLDDLFLILGNIDEETGATTILAVVNPLVSFIWLGGLLLTVGAVTGLFSFAPKKTARAEKRAARPLALKLGAVAAIALTLPFFFVDPIYPVAAWIAAALAIVTMFFGRALPALFKKETP